MIAAPRSGAAQLRRDLLTSMLRIRRVEETIAERYADGEMRCPVHLSIGQEAVAAGMSAALTRRDYAFSTHRAHAHYLAKGGNLAAFFAELHGKETGCARGRGGSMHAVDLDAGFMGATPIIGSSLPVAVGAAFGSAMLRDGRVTVVYIGDAATEEGVFSESLNFAALKALPVIFVCENNLYSVYSPLAVRQAAGRDTVALAAAHGMPALRDDGNDVERVHERAAAAVRRARAGEGPTFIEFATYRWREHCGPEWDNALGYRTVAEFEAWRERCPIGRLRARMLANGDVDATEIAAIEAAIATEVDAAYAAAQAAPFPPADQLLVDEYAQVLA